MKYSSCNRTILIIVLLVSVVFMGTFPPASAAGNFGNDHQGSDGHSDLVADSMICGKWTLGSVEQYTDTIMFYGRATSATYEQGRGIICDSSLNIVAGGIGDIVEVTNSNGWQTLTFSENVTLEADTTYYLGVVVDYDSWVYRDTTGDWAYDSSNSFTDPIDPTDAVTDTTYELSIYAVTYDDPPDTRTASSGVFDGQNEVNSWESTKAKDGTDWYGDPTCILTLTFPIRNDTWSFDYHFYAEKEGVISGEVSLEVYNFDTTSWFELLDDLTESPAWYNGTIENSAYMDTINNIVKFRLDSVFLYYPRWDYADITIYYGPHPEWQINNILEFFFPVKITPEQQFGYDAFFIFLGLIMIPVSTMYLVRGGRKDMSADKLFFGLIIFAVGFGFLIGGILP